MSVKLKVKDGYVLPKATQKVIESSLTDMKTTSSREQRALEAGWEPFHPSHNLLMGVIDPVSWMSVVKGHLQVAAVCLVIAMALGALGGWLS